MVIHEKLKTSCVREVFENLFDERAEWVHTCVSNHQAQVNLNSTYDMELLHKGIDEDFFNRNWRNFNYYLKYVTIDSVFDLNDPIPAENHHRIKFLKDQFDAVQASLRKPLPRKKFALTGDLNWQEELKKICNSWKTGKFFVIKISNILEFFHSKI